jgi:transcription elongation factor Elf1
VIERIAEKQTDRMNQQTEIICSLCNNNNNKTLIVSDPISGEMICQNCGQVISGRELQTSPEWLVVDTNERVRNRIRAGRPRSLARHDMGLATRIGSMDKDARGHPLDSAVCSTTFLAPIILFFFCLLFCYYDLNASFLFFIWRDMSLPFF